MDERNGTPHPPSDRHTQLVLAALKEAIGSPGEHRLFRGGKLAGLFPARIGPAGEAATFAVEHALLEPTRTETKGKATIEWVRLTPQGVDFLHAHDSPKAILQELRDTLQATREGIPRWLQEMAEEFRTFTNRCTSQFEELTRRLDQLTDRVDRALRREDARRPELPEATAQLIPWAMTALEFLDRRREGGAAEACPLPELFAALRRTHATLSLTEYHDGLRRLADVRAIRLSEGVPDEIREPEYALLDGAKMLYRVSR